MKTKKVFFWGKQAFNHVWSQPKHVNFNLAYYRLFFSEAGVWQSPMR